MFQSFLKSFFGEVNIEFTFFKGPLCKVEQHLMARKQIANNVDVPLDLTSFVYQL